MTDYDSIDAVNYSTMKWAITHSLKHYKHALDTGYERTEAMAIGAATHAACLQRPVFDRLYARKPDGMTFASSVGKEWKAAHSDKTILSATDYDRCLEMSDSVMSHPIAGEYIRGLFMSEFPIVWTDPDTGVPCKARIDGMSGAGCLTLIELKTAADIRHDAFARKAASLLYHVQLAYYYDGAVIADKAIEELHQVMIIVESSPPYDVSVDVVQEDARHEGRRLYKAALAQIKQATADNYWPGVSPNSRLYDIPVWAREEQDDGLNA